MQFVKEAESVAWQVELAALDLLSNREAVTDRSLMSSEIRSNAMPIPRRATNSTTRALTSALKARRFLMTSPFLGLILLHLDVCPSFEGQYIHLLAREGPC